MGFFDWFRRRRERLPIRVFLDEASSAAARRQHIAGHLARPGHVLMVAHFEAALVAAGRDLATAGIPFATKDRWTTSDTAQLAANRQPAVLAMLARALPDVAADAPRSAVAGGLPIAVVVVDLHVRAAANARIVRFANALPAGSLLHATTSLDHPLMQCFASPWVKTMMQRMGLKPGEPIDSPMVAGGIAKAMSKLEKRAFSDFPCQSIEAWLQRNVQN